ncbi:MAG: DUF748 domain-containing protein [Candidatus Omnitrophota bacterium]
MKKIIISASLIVILLTAIGIYFLNAVILPTKIHALIVSGLEKQTGARVTLKSLKFNIFQGLVLKDLVVSQQEKVIFSVREVNCSVFILPIFNKQVVIPGITLKAPYLFLERSAENKLNIQDMFKPAAGDSGQGKQQFRVIVYKVNIVKGNIAFRDNSLPGVFKKELNDIYLTLGFSLPQSVKFSLKAQASGEPAAMIKASGAYNLISRELSCRIWANPVSLKDLQAYTGSWGVDVLSGTLGISGQVDSKDDLLNASILADVNNLGIARDKLSARLTGQALSDVSYNLKSRDTRFKGSFDISAASLAGLGNALAIDNIKGKVLFDNNGLRSDQLDMEALGIKLSAALTLEDFNHPRLAVNSKIDLALLPDKLKAKFGVNPLSSASGTGALSLNMQQDPGQDAWRIKGSLSLAKASLGFNKDSLFFNDIKGMVEFNQDQVNILGAVFVFQGVNYKASGVLTNFAAPVARVVLSADNFSGQADFSITGKKVDLSGLECDYFNSKASLSGNIDNTDPQKPQVDLKGTALLQLEDLSLIFPEARKTLLELKPAGKISAVFNLSGNPLDIKRCLAQADLYSSDFSLYGFHSTDFLLNYAQSAGIAEISPLFIALYDGTVDVAAKLNLNSANLPYWVSLKAQRVDLGKLKLDTAFKNKNLGGIVQFESKVSGFSNDLSKLSGAGKISITEGKLWELNLFQGLGKVLFARDFANIVFSEGSCSFSVKNKSVFTDKLKLKSNMANLAGPVAIGFDGSLEAALDVEVLSDLVPLSGTLKDITTAIVGEAGSFGMIRLSGTLKEPKYKFQPAVTNLIKGLKNILMGN